MRCIQEQVWPEILEWGSALKSHLIRFLGIFLALVLFHFLLQVVLQGLFLSHTLLSYVSKEIDVLLDVRVGISDESLEGVLAEMGSREGVESVTLVPAREALLYVDREVAPGYAAFLERYHLDNPFSSYVRIRVSDPELLKSLEQDILAEYPTFFSSGIGDSEMVTERVVQDAVSLSFGISSAVRSVVFSLLVLIVLTHIFLLWWVLGYRKHELKVFHIVFAHRSYQRWSFWCMGLFLGLFAFLLGYFLFSVSLQSWGPVFLWQMLGVVFLSLLVAEAAYRS